MNTKGENKICTDCNKEFTIDSGDFLLYEKVGLEPSNICFHCRLQGYFAFWPFGKFRKGVSDFSGESLITILPAHPRYPIYKSKEWWGDGWDAMDFGQDYDPSRKFFDQLKEVQEKVPRPHQAGENNTNCDWCDDVWECKNCYLSRSVFRCENINYGYRLIGCKDSNDLALSYNLQNSYDCLECHDSYNLNFSENSRDCIDSYFLYDCRNCQHCFMSWNLRNKQYCIRNVQYTKEDYETEMAKIQFDSQKTIETLKKEYEEILKKEAVHRENFNIKTTNSTGNYLINCDKCVNVFSWEESQNCRNMLRGLANKDCIDQVGCWKLEMSGDNSCVQGDGYNLRHSSWSNGRYSDYLDNCIEVEYCFGCIGLKKKKYCILNKQYSKEEYEKIKATIVENMKKDGEYGKFLPYSMGLCEYNFSTASIYLPEVKKETILKLGGYWLDEDLTSTEGVPSLDLPDSILETEADVSTKALICPESKYRFNISPSEYEFHKRKKIALPRIHFDLRMIKKGRKTATLKTTDYQCHYCKKEINAYYPTEWGYHKIACEECYKQNIA